MRFSRWIDGWQGTLLVGATYIYFLIFAQFAFIARLDTLGIAGTGLKSIMVAMACGGILLSLTTPRMHWIASPVRRLRIGMGICATAALGSLLPFTLTGAAIVAFVVGAGLGVTTVTLVTHLAAWAGNQGELLKVGLGTGLGYFVCNIPEVFTATPGRQAVFAALVFLGAMLIPLRDPSREHKLHRTQMQSFPFVTGLTAFAALIWLDSAGFYIIQHAPMLKAGTWIGNAHLWTNACVHLGAAIVAALLLERRKAGLVLALAAGSLGLACFLLHYPALILSASACYPAGVSFYSVALVAYPSWLSPSHSADERGRQAGWIYAVAGWVGSALGIGMGQNLGEVPLPFVVVTSTIVLVPILLGFMKARAREVALLGSAMMVAFVGNRAVTSDAVQRPKTAIEQGREVYVSEGCISCHSQYVRPNSGDELMWGPTESLAEVHRQQPPLIGNRRQGPDLTQVGARRSRLWLKVHLINPKKLSDGSIMPSYAFLFADRRGDDLVEYLASLQSPMQMQHPAEEAAWRPSEIATRQSSLEEGHTSYERSCATCHDRNGEVHLQYGFAFRKPPVDLLSEAGDDSANSFTRVSQIIKFGIPGTDMPGHEYWSDREVVSLARWLMQVRSSSRPNLHSKT